MRFRSLVRSQLVVALLAFAIASQTGCFLVGYEEDRVRKGSAYGFSIGQSHSEVFDGAMELKRTGEIAEIHRWPAGTPHFEFGPDELQEALLDPRWSMIVNPEWWNDSITLEFEDDTLVEIYRFRICCELP